MTETEARLEELKTVPPRPRRRFRDQLERVLAWVTALVAAVALSIGLSNTSCINDNLGARQGPSTKDAQAHLDFAQDILDAFGGKLTKAQFQADVIAYRAQLLADKTERDAHPLGKC